MKLPHLLFTLALVACGGGKDADGDGILADFDCDDDDASLGAIAADADCDGALITDDCDDADAAIGSSADDADCDGAATADDCDDADPAVGSNADDTDCDGIPNDDDSCPEVANADDIDLDLDGIDDACDDFRELVLHSIPVYENGLDNPEHWDCFDGFDDHCMTRSSGRPLYNPMLQAQYEGGEGIPSPLGFLFNAGNGLSGQVDGGEGSLSFGWAGLTNDNWKPRDNIGRRWGVRLIDPADLTTRGVQDFPDIEPLEEWEFFLGRWHGYSRGGGEWMRSYVTAFEKADNADPTDAANQDCISDSVCLTRGNSGSIYNAASETMAGDTSPAGTLWFRGRTEDAVVGEYTDFITMHGGAPQDLLDEDISVYIEAEDRYYDIVFTSWTGGGPGGGFALRRTRAIVRGCGDPQAEAYDPRVTWHFSEACVTGDEIYFEKLPYMDRADVNDCLTDDLCISRGSNNLLEEVTQGNEENMWWAPGRSADQTSDDDYRDSLQYAAPGGRPQNLPGNTMSLRVPNEASDAWLYFDLTFHEWGPANGNVRYTRVDGDGPNTTTPEPDNADTGDPR